MLQQDGRDVQQKWDEVRTIWDGYAGVIVEADWRRGHTRTATLLRDGRFLIMNEPGEYVVQNNLRQFKTVDHFDGVRRIKYDAISNEYVVLQDHEPQDWLHPFLFFWGKAFARSPFKSVSADLVAPDGGDEIIPTGFIVSFNGERADLLHSLYLRNRDMTPLLDLQMRPGRKNFDLHYYKNCRPIIHQRHCDREVEWSLPPDARLVEHLDGNR